MLRILSVITIIYTTRFVNHHIHNSFLDKLQTQGIVQPQLLLVLKNHTETYEDIERFINVNLILQ
jgi:hypothetical protein